MDFKQPFSDLALNQPASQISTVHGGSASRAVDGGLSTAFGAGSCTHTDYATDAWWRVDLGSSFPVAEVVIANRLCNKGYECAGFMNSFEIRIGELLYIHVTSIQNVFVFFVFFLKLVFFILLLIFLFKAVLCSIANV